MGERVGVLVIAIKRKIGCTGSFTDDENNHLFTSGSQRPEFRVGQQDLVAIGQGAPVKMPCGLHNINQGKILLPKRDAC